MEYMSQNSKNSLINEFGENDETDQKEVEKGLPSTKDTLSFTYINPEDRIYVKTPSQPRKLKKKKLISKNHFSNFMKKIEHNNTQLTLLQNRIR